MPQHCPNCQTSNHDDSRFCSVCGHSLELTQVQGRTVVMQPAVAAAPVAPPPPPIDTKTIIQRTQQAFGTQPIQVMPGVTTQIHNQQEDTACVIDVSGSMGGVYDSRYNKLEAAIRAYSSMIAQKAQIDPNDRIGVASFNSRARILLSLTPLATGKRQILSTLQSLRHSNGTDQNKGLKAAAELLDWTRHDVVRRIVMLTDGHGGHPLETAEQLKANGVVIDVIGVGDNPTKVNEQLLRQVASVIEGESRYRFIKDQQTLVAHYTALANKTATA